MIDYSVPLGKKWKEILDLNDRCMPDLFERNDEISGTPYVAAIRTALNELGLSAVFCVNGVPTIALIRLNDYDQDLILQIHAALWNQGLASVLAVISGDVLRVFSLAKLPESENAGDFEDRCLIETLNTTSSLMRLQSLATGAETGRLWREERDFFRSGDRVDAVLLNNLEQAHDLLNQSGLTSDQAQAILIQTMFVAYLEDRKIIGPDYFEQATGEKNDSFSEILGDGVTKNVDVLFKKLRNDFNGDLFVAPCSFTETKSEVKLNKEQFKILQRFRLGREEMRESGGQLRFWGYDFRYIPVELISAVYDRFLGKDIATQKNTGAYYTPMFLADNVVSSTWANMSPAQKETATFLDPACGSGIFLVRSFQRLCEHWRETRHSKTIRWDSLKKILTRIQGRDINSGAVRVAVFSLYLALLEQISPPDLRKLIDSKGLLPTLWGKTIINMDFFDEVPNDTCYDIIVGNPPWTSRKGHERSALDWTKTNGYPIPQGEEAWAFTWKALLHLKPTGLVSFLLPAMGFLHNNSEVAISARTQLFTKSHVKQVVNFSDLRFQLFDGAIRPATLLIIGHLEHEGSVYEFDYWTPKADLNLITKRSVTLSTADRTKILSSNISKDDLIFKHRLWMRGPEAKLYSFLSRLPKLKERVTTSRTAKTKSDTWVIGQGFQPFNSGKTTSKPLDSSYVGTSPYLAIGDFTALSIDPSIKEPWQSDKVRRRGFEDGFDGPRILIPRGVKTSRWRLRAAYTERPLTFQDIFQAITVPAKDKKSAKLLTGLLNSRLALWYAFHGTASFGADRPEVKQAELIKLPFPKPNDLADPEKAEQALLQIIKIVDAKQKPSADLLQSPDADEKILHEIDKLAYEYFGLTDDEIILIEDAAKYIIPSAQPNAGSFPDIWKETSSDDRCMYTDILKNRLTGWFDDGTHLNSKLVARNLDFAILRLSLDNYPDSYTEDNCRTFTESLAELSKELGKPLNGNFILLPDIRIFIGTSLYLIKPLQKRFWLRSTALADADSIALDLELTMREKEQRGVIS